MASPPATALVPVGQRQAGQDQSPGEGSGLVGSVSTFHSSSLRRRPQHPRAHLPDRRRGGRRPIQCHRLQPAPQGAVSPPIFTVPHTRRQQFTPQHPASPPLPRRRVRHTPMHQHQATLACRRPRPWPWRGSSGTRVPVAPFCGSTCCRRLLTPAPLRRSRHPPCRHRDLPFISWWQCSRRDETTSRTRTTS